MAQQRSAMTESLSERLGLGSRELVAIVGAGGKTTILHTLAAELGSRHARVVITTTTRMAPDQITEPLIFSNERLVIDERLVPGIPLFVLSELTVDKAVGLPPHHVDEIFSKSSADYLIVEADGARTLPIKAPAAHEPVIPQAATTVVVVIGADAFGQPFANVAHRVDQVTALTGFSGADIVTPERAASILLHRSGGLKGIPTSARVVMAITKVTPNDRAEVAQLIALLTMNPYVDRCVELAHH